MEKTISKITKNLEGKVVVRVQDDVIDTRILLRTKDNRWAFVRKGISLKPVVINELLEAIKAVREELCGNSDDVKKRR